MGLSLTQKKYLHASLAGMAVDYLTRYLPGSSAEEAFEISLSGSFLVGDMVKVRLALLRAILSLGHIRTKEALICLENYYVIKQPG